MLRHSDYWSESVMTIIGTENRKVTIWCLRTNNNEKKTVSSELLEVVKTIVLRENWYSQS